MSYLFPKRVLRTGDVLNPIELTEDVSPAADSVSGRLNAHNLNDTISTAAAIDPGAFYDKQYVEKNVEIYWTGTSGSGFVPGPGEWGSPDEGTVGGDEVLVQNNFEWQPLVSVNGDPTEVQITTGTSVLWINAYVQYVWWGFNGDLFGSGGVVTGAVITAGNQHFNGAMKYPVNLQFALRVDGTILPETITGIDDLTYRASVPIKPTAQVSGGTIFPGPADALGKQICGLGPPVLPVRVGACYPVQPGNHVVELIVRRVPVVTNNSEKQYGPMDRVYLYSRQIHVVDLKMFPVDSVTASEVTADAFETEDPLSQTSLYTNRVQRVTNAYNAITEGALQRGALTHAHLPVTLLNYDSHETTYGSGRTHNNWFPGHNDDTVTTTLYSGAPGIGWGQIQSLQVSGFAIQHKMRVLVLANLQVRNISGNTFSTSGGGENTQVSFGAIGDFALFKIMWQPTGTATWNGVDSSLCVVNNFAWWPKKENLTPAEAYLAFGLENVEIQLMAELTFTGPTVLPIDIGLFGSVANDDTEFLYTRGSIQAIGFRD